ncbi:cation:proton antiporter [Mariniluteicoccus flavus]
MAISATYVVTGLALLLAVVLPVALRRIPLSAPIILIGVGVIIGMLPISVTFVSPLKQRNLTEHLTEFCVLVALMGVGLALDRPLSFRDRGSWRAWSATWRLLGIAMPLCIAGVAVLGWGLMGLPIASAVLLGAALSPTDPVLASDVQVEGPATDSTRRDDDRDDDKDDEGDDADQPVGSAEVDESDEVRFALTSEAGLNDGLAFPFVYAAIFLASKGPVQEWGLHWFGWELVGKIVVGVAVGVLCGWLLARIAFRSRADALRVAEKGEPLLALAVLLLTYGLAELVEGYGFIAVFAAAMTLRSTERHHDYHRQMHEMIERLEQLVTLVALLLLGVALSDGLLKALTWQGALVAILLILVVRPVAAYASLALFADRERIGNRPVSGPERRAIAFFGVRGIGSLYYLAYATGHATFPGAEQLWATVGFAVLVSVIVHGVAATPVMKRLEERG